MESRSKVIPEMKPLLHAINSYDDDDNKSYIKTIDPMEGRIYNINNMINTVLNIACMTQADQQ